MGDADALLAGLGRPRPGDGVTRASGDRVVATYVLQGAPSLAAAAEAVAVEESTGLTRPDADVTARVGGEVLAVEVAGVARIALPAAPLARAGVAGGEVGRVTVAWASANAATLPGLLTMVVGETLETGTFGACRLVGLALPDALLGALAGPAFGTDAFAVPGRPVLGAIVKPSTGLDPSGCAEVAAVLARGGADLVKDDELLTDPPFCRYAERVGAVRAAVAAVEDATGRRVVYAPNATGDLDGLGERLALARDSGCGGVMLNALAVGLETLRWAAGRAGVPVFAHRVGSGALVRPPAVGVSPGVLAGLTRLAGGDLVQVGAVAGKMFEDDAVVVDAADACLGALGRVRAALPVVGGGMSHRSVGPVAAEMGERRFCHLLGSAAVEDPGGAEAGVRRALAAWEAL